MSVSARHTARFASLAGGALALGLTGLAGVALAGGNSGGSPCCGGGTGPVVPSPGVTAPPHGPVFGPVGGSRQASPCCGLPKGQNVVVPNVVVPGPNVSVSTPKITVNQGGVNVNQGFVSNQTIFGSTGNDGFVVLGGGGGYFGGAQPVAPSAVGALNVEGGAETYTDVVTEQVPVTENTCIPRTSSVAAIRPVQAVCIDDTGTPHPASRIDDSIDISTDFSGEVYRCMAGTRMQVTLGTLDHGAPSFAQGESFQCQKGEALVHRPHEGLVCAPQAPQRDCNERSLLRRYGPGIKRVHATVTQSYCEPTTRTVMRSVTREVVRERETAPGNIVFDGGVGQGIY